MLASTIRPLLEARKNRIIALLNAERGSQDPNEAFIQELKEDLALTYAIMVCYREHVESTECMNALK